MLDRQKYPFEDKEAGCLPSLERARWPLSVRSSGISSWLNGSIVAYDIGKAFVDPSENVPAQPWGLRVLQAQLVPANMMDDTE